MKLVKILALVVLAAALAGCMQVKMDTVIDKNGGGTYAFTYSTSKDVEDALTEMRGLGGQSADQMKDAPDFANFDKAAFEKDLAKNHVKLLSYDNKMDADKRTVSMKLGFESLDDLSKALGSSFGGEGMGLTKNEDGNYVLSAVEVEKEAAEADTTADAEKAPDEQDMQAAMQNASKSMAVMGKLMSHMSEMSMQLEITVPGEVLENNAQRVEGKTCYWNIDSSNMMQMQGFEPRIVFSSKGVDIKTD